MKILCVADERDPLVYSTNVVERYGDVDLVISAGDLPLKYYEFIVSSLNKPFYFVFGNHHLDDLSRFTRTGGMDGSFELGYDRTHHGWGVGGDYIDGRVLRDSQSGLLLAGLGGSMRYNNGGHQFTEFEMFLRIFKMIPKLFYNRIRHGRFVDILITHAPPRGLGDREDRCHTGFKAFLWFMRHFKPRYLVHGHVHLIDMNAQRVLQYRQTEIINVFGSYLLERD